MRWLLGLVAVLAVGVAGWFVVGSSGVTSDPYGDASGGDGGALERAAPALLGAAGEPLLATGATTGAFTLRGTVHDADGKAIAGARIVARRTGSFTWDPRDLRTWGDTAEDQFRKSVSDLDAAPASQPPPDVETTSGADGSFELHPSLGGSYEVRAILDPPWATAGGSANLTRSNPTATVALTARLGTPLRGRVVEGDGANEKGVVAEIKGYSVAENGTWAWAVPVASGEDGTFSFDALTKGLWRLEVRVPGRLTLRGVQVTMPRDEVFVVKLGEGTGTVVGTVKDPKQSPVASATVLLTVANEAAGSSTTVRGVTAPDGSYRIPTVPPGKVTAVHAHADRHAVHRGSPPLALWSGAAVQAGKETRVDVTLEVGSTVEGRVLEAGTGKPLASAEVFVTLSARTGFARPFAATTGPDGAYRFEGVPPGKALLIARAPRHYLKVLADQPGQDAMRYMGPDGSGGAGGPPPEIVLVVGTEGGTIQRDLTLHPGLGVRGKVIDGAGRPVEGAEIRAKGVGLGSSAWRWGINWPGGSMDVVATSAPDGSFEATPVPPGDGMVLYAKKSPLVGAASEPFAVGGEAPATEVVLRLQTGGVIAGRVVGPDGAVAGAQVNVWGQWTEGTMPQTYCQSDASGAWRLEGLPPGRCTLNVSSTKLRGTQVPVEGLGAGEVREGIVVTLEGGVRVSGTLFDAEGKPLSGRMLTLSSQMGNQGWTHTTTDAEGAFEFANAPKGRVQIQLQSNDEGWKSLQGGNVEAPASGVRLVLDQGASQVIDGVVLDAHGAPVPLCRVTIQGAGRGAEQPTYYGGAGDANECVNGRFRRVVNAKPPLAVTVSSARDARGVALNLRTKKVTVDRLDEPVEIRLEEGTEVAGTVVSTEGRGLAGAYVFSGSSSARTDDAGAFCLGGFESGDVTLQVTPPRGMVTPAPVKTRAGIRDVRVEVEGGLPIAGTVLDPDGQPMSNGNVNATWPATNRVAAGSRSTQLESGRFRVDGVPAGVSVTLQVNTWTGTGSTAPATLEGVSPGTTNVEIRTEKGLAVTGVVVDVDGKPFTAAWLHAMAEGEKRQAAPGAMVQPDGTFRLEGLKPGSYRITVQRQDGGPAPEPVRVTAPASGVRFQMPRAEKIAGRVHGSGDLSGFHISVSPDGTFSGRRSAMTSSDGTFTVDGVGSGGQTLIVRKETDDRYAFLSGVQPGTTNASLELQTGLSIEGTVDGVGKGGFVQAQSSTWHAYARPSADGAFVIRGLPQGRYRLTAHAEGSMATEEDVAAGTTGVRLRLNAAR